MKWNEFGQGVTFLHNKSKPGDLMMDQWIAQTSDRENAKIVSVQAFMQPTGGMSVVLVLERQSKCAECERPVGRDNYLCEKCHRLSDDLSN